MQALDNQLTAVKVGKKENRGKVPRRSPPRRNYDSRREKERAYFEISDVGHRRAVIQAQCQGKKAAIDPLSVAWGGGLKMWVRKIQGPWMADKG